MGLTKTITLAKWKSIEKDVEDITWPRGDTAFLFER